MKIEINTKTLLLLLVFAAVVGAGYGAATYYCNDNACSLPGTNVTTLNVSGEIHTTSKLGVNTVTPDQVLTVNGGINILSGASLSPSAVHTLSFETPVSRYYVGDGTGYSYTFSRRTGGVTTDIMTVNDNITSTTLITNLSILPTAKSSCITMFSPDGTSYKFQIANGGTTSVTAGTCN